MKKLTLEEGYWQSGFTGKGQKNIHHADIGMKKLETTFLYTCGPHAEDNSTRRRRSRSKKHPVHELLQVPEQSRRICASIQSTPAAATNSSDTDTRGMRRSA